MSKDLLLKTGKRGPLFNQPTLSPAIYLKVLVLFHLLQWCSRWTATNFKTIQISVLSQGIECNRVQKQRNSIIDTCKLLLKSTSQGSQELSYTDTQSLQKSARLLLPKTAVTRSAAHSPWLNNTIIRLISYAAHRWNYLISHSAHSNQ